MKAIISLCTLLLILTSCHGQTKSNDTAAGHPSKPVAIGRTVAQPGNQLWYVFQDSNSHYWFSSNGEGVYRFDGKSITNFTVRDGLASDSIRKIQEDKLGNIYIETLGGINKFDGQQITTLKPIKSKTWKLEPDDLWFSLLGKKNENGPYRFDGKHLYHLEFPKHYLHDEITNSGINPFFSPYEVYSIYKDRSGALWFGTSVFGACRFDGTSLKWLYEKDLTIVPESGGSFGIRSVFEDKAGHFWICNTRQRFVFDLEKTATRDRLEYRTIAGIGNAQAFNGEDYVYYSHILEGNEGDIWLTTWASGLYRYDGKTIANYTVRDNNKTVNLVSMYKDRAGVLWLGTAENGVFRFNGTGFERFRP